MTDAKAETLLPCPFCGRLDTLKLITAQDLAEEGDDDPPPWEHSESWAVMCDGSSPRGPGGCGASGGFMPSQSQAVATWNLRRAALAAQPATVQPVEPVAWRDHVEQRIRTWRQRTMNKSGDRLAIDDFMGQESIDDLVDFVCDEYAAPPAPAAVPPGWKLVPIEPTRAMIASGAVALMKASHSDIDPTMEEVTAAYRAMTAAVKPATAVPLTDERIVELFRETFLAHTDPLGKDNMTIAFARAIERAHSIAAGDKLCGG